MTKAAPSYIRLHHNSDLPREDGIYAFHSDDGFLVKVASQKAESGFGLRWVIYAYHNPQRVIYKIRIQNDSMSTMRGEECFLRGIREMYPEDLEIFIWHPDLLGSH